MENKPVCKGDHSCHLCQLVMNKSIDEIKPLVDKPAYICFNCGRAANDARNLCNPEPLG